MVIYMVKNIKINIENYHHSASKHGCMFVRKVLKLSRKGGINMTENQISYFKAREEVRHNQAQESIQQRQAEASTLQAQAAASQAQTAQLSQAETARHQRATEGISWYDAVRKTTETARHNKELERQGQLQISGQLQNWASTAEATLRQASVAEKRAELESIDVITRQRQAAAAEVSAQGAYLRGLAGMQQSSVAASQLQESIRHNKVSESLASRETGASESRAEAYASSLKSQAAQGWKHIENETKSTEAEAARDYAQVGAYEWQSFRDGTAGILDIAKTVGEVVDMTEKVSPFKKGAFSHGR